MQPCIESDLVRRLVADRLERSAGIGVVLGFVEDDSIAALRVVPDTGWWDFRPVAQGVMIEFRSIPQYDCDQWEIRRTLA